MAVTDARAQLSVVKGTSTANVCQAQSCQSRPHQSHFTLWFSFWLGSCYSHPSFPTTS